MKRWPMWIVTFGGSGLLKPAPGTWGSLAAIIVLFVLRPVIAPNFWPIVLIVFTATAGTLNVMLGAWIVREMGEDPGPCVIDEAAGIGLTLLALPMAHPAITFALAFVAFRLFDVTKPPPARQLENLPLGWGILCDDLAAAVYANIVCQIILRVF